MNVRDRMIDDNNRVGVITEIREGGVFARPENMAYRVDAAGLVPGVNAGTAITATWWRLEADGSFVGIWCDDTLSTTRTARLLT